MRAARTDHTISLQLKSLYATLRLPQLSRLYEPQAELPTARGRRAHSGCSFAAFSQYVRRLTEQPKAAERMTHAGTPFEFRL